MSWKDVCVMCERVEFVALASAEGANVSELCRRFGVSRKTGYKWLSRSAAQGRAGLLDQSRRPKVSAGQIDGAAEQQRRPLDDWWSFLLTQPRGSEAATIDRSMPGCFSARYFSCSAPPIACCVTTGYVADVG